MKKLIALTLLSTFLTMNYGIAATTSQEMEHLSQNKKVEKKAQTTLVAKTPASATVLEYNLIEVTFAEDFSSKTAMEGDEIDFLLNDGLKTQEGTTILPQGTILKGQIIGVQKPKSFNRSGKVTLKFENFELPDGQKIPLSAKLFKKDFLSRGKLNALGKGLGTTLGASAVGIGAGCGIGVAAGAVIVGGFAIGLPIGFAVGALAGLVTPGLYYKAKAGDKILIQLTDDLTVSN
ncbi:hypothetical protein IJS77_02145 [bacterium]|nr:hypothetical protein [bacterium]